MNLQVLEHQLALHVFMVSTVLRVTTLVFPAMLLVMAAWGQRLPALLAAPTTNPQLPTTRPVLYVLSASSLLRETPLAQLAISPATDAMEQQPPVITVRPTTSQAEVGRPALSVPLASTVLKATTAAKPVISHVLDATEQLPTVLTAPSTTNLQEADQHVLSVPLTSTVLLEIPPVLPATSHATAAMRPQQLA